MQNSLPAEKRQLQTVRNSRHVALAVATLSSSGDQFTTQTATTLGVYETSEGSFPREPEIRLAENPAQINGFSPCTLSASSLNLSRQVECLTLDAPLDSFAKSSEHGEVIPLSIVRLKARSRSPRLDPLLLLAGGPGQAASEVYLFADSQYQKLSRYRDIYLIDQRGTGRSAAFRCKDLGQSDDAGALEASKIESAVAACLAEFPYDAQYFTSAYAIEDLEFVRKTLNIPQWNVLGTSYGTRVALHYLRKYPAAIRTTVLDSVVYPELNLGLDIAAQSDRALQALIKRCNNDTDCSAAFPNLHDGIEQLFTLLHTTPMAFDYEDIKSGRTQSMQFTAQHLALVIRLALYQDELFALLPAMLHEAYANKHFSPLARSVQLYQEAMLEGLYVGMHNSVACSEDYAYYQTAEIAEAESQHTYLGSDFIRNLKTVCGLWPVGYVDGDFKAPLVSAKPVLLLSGSEDPITPPEYAERVAKTLSNSLTVVLPGQGHSVSGIGCVPTLIAQFIETESVADLNSSCVDKLRPAPFFLNFNGPAP